MRRTHLEGKIEALPKHGCVGSGRAGSNTLSGHDRHAKVLGYDNPERIFVNCEGIASKLAPTACEEDISKSDR